jgi:hypothetical protein
LLYTVHMHLGPGWRSWLRHCVAGSIPDSVIGIFCWHNPFGRTIALGSTQPLNRNEYQEYFLGGKRGRCVGLTTLPPSSADFLEIWDPQPPGTLMTWPGLYRDYFGFTLHMHLLITFITTSGWPVIAAIIGQRYSYIKVKNWGRGPSLTIKTQVYSSDIMPNNGIKMYINRIVKMKTLQCTGKL